ncbi:MAG: type II toxin-antitoxin system RelE/ParE family toxin [Rhizobiales bacterium]|nr:type II toxin-antitoxin system RelE/ParE family toxin [Hyphomicrobiales bacterium]
MRVRFSRPALAELEAILINIENNNPPAARQFARRLDGVVNRIAQFPTSAREIAGRPGVRRLPLVRYPYVLYYRIFAGEVIILRIIHGARHNTSEGS